jgi:hypothetical protein
MIRYKLNPVFDEWSSEQNSSMSGFEQNNLPLGLDYGTFWPAKAPALTSSVTSATDSSLYTVVSVNNGGMTFNLEFVNADNPTQVSNQKSKELPPSCRRLSPTRSPSI